MNTKFIYTKDAETCEALKEAGFQDLGTIIGKELQAYMFSNSPDLEVPSKYKPTCWFSNSMFFVSPEGGDSDEQRRQQTSIADDL